MMMKLYMVTLVVGVFSLSNPTPAEGLNRPDFSAFKAPKILNIDRTGGGFVFDRDFPHRSKQKVEMAAFAPFVGIENSWQADRCWQEPVLCGLLILFTFATFGALGYIVHLFRNDTNFC